MRPARKTQKYRNSSVRNSAGSAKQLNNLFVFPGNSPPNITGDDIFFINVGEENVYTFLVNDTNEFNVTIEGRLPEGSALINDGDEVYIFMWTPRATPADGVSFVAVDSMGAATLHSPVVQVCACFNGGECTEEGVQVTSDLVQILTCLCTEGMNNKIK